MTNTYTYDPGEHRMIRFQVVAGLEKGLDIRKAGELVKEAIQYKEKITILNGSKTGDAKLIFNVMSLNIKKGDRLTVTVEGEKEEEAARSLEKYMRENL